MYSPIADRKTSFKKGLDAGEGRRNRNETTISLRKNKREEGLAKRRMATPALAPAETSASSPERKIYTTTDIPQLAAALSQPNIDGAKLLEVARGFRKILSVENNPPVLEVLESGVLPALVQMLTCHDKPDVQFEAAWALTNIASTDYTNVVAESGAIPLFVGLLSHSSAELRDQSAWCLGNIAGDGPALRDLVLDAGAMQPLIANVMQPASTSLLNNCVWALSNFCRGKPAPELELVKAAVPVLASILIGGTEGDARTDALWALSYLSDGADERIQTVVDCQGLVPRLIELLGSHESSVLTPALRTVGNIVSGNDSSLTQAVIDAGLMKVMPELLQNAKKSVKKEACWVMSNIAAGTQDQIQTTFKGGLSHVVHLAEQSEYDIKKEAIWTLSNIATGGSATQVKALVETSAIPALCDMLDVNDAKMLLVALDAIEAILKTGDAENKDFISFVDEADGIRRIEELQEHQSEEVYDKAIQIIETYFGTEDGMEDENLAPMTDGNMFAFGVTHKEVDTSFDASTSAAPMQFNF